MTEPGAGSDLQNIKSRAIDQGGYYTLSGTKTFITNGYLSDVVVVAAKTDPSKGARGISLFVVDKEMQGLPKEFHLKKSACMHRILVNCFSRKSKFPKKTYWGSLEEVLPT
ncbi:acyl-CoA dehydrogenase family protein [Echinicola jeungdonensis]|uniref:acyl-CoA dehydrogenase family protein n=1 Tax=Echinicola jeungdonensis TaxID=709343 RepID=UPI00338F681C